MDYCCRQLNDRQLQVSCTSVNFLSQDPKHCQAVTDKLESRESGSDITLHSFV